MSFVLLIVIIGTLILVVITGNEKITQFKNDKEEIPYFSVDVEFSIQSSNFKLHTGSLDCNINHQLIPCDTREPFKVLNQCKELLVKCQNFKKDTYYASNDEIIEIKANKNEHEGYALAIINTTDVEEKICNLNHGDLILVTADDVSNEYMFICHCKKPGYIGNDTLLGNCTTVYMCGGNIDYINKPLKEINCICNDREMVKRDERDGLSYCKEMTVLEADKRYENIGDWSHLVPWNSERLIGIEAYNVTISGQLGNLSKLLDPCRNSILDTSIEIIGAKFNVVNGECQFKDYGYPIESRLLNYKPKLGIETMTPEHKKVNDKSDARIGAGIPTGKYVKIRYLDNVDSKRKISAIEVKGVNLDNKLYGNEYFGKLKKINILLVAPLGTALSDVGPLSITTKSNFIAPTCVGDWPFYDCFFHNYYIGLKYGLPKCGSRTAPWTFPWEVTYWKTMEETISQGTTYTARGIFFNNMDLASLKNFYGLQFVSESSEQNEQNGVLLFTNDQNYVFHQQKLT